MMRLLLIIFLLLILFNAIILDKALGMLSPKELKRRARGGHDKKAASIYKMSAYGRSLGILLWLKGVAAAVILFAVLISHSWLWALIFIAVTTWLVRVWQPAGTTSWSWSWASAVSPTVSWVMNYLKPVLRRLEGLSKPSPPSHAVYEQEDLVELLQAQAKNPENRIPEEDLKIAAGALMFGSQDVGGAMTPLRKVRIVHENEQVGPLLMDELHDSGFSRFPVTSEGGDKSTPEIIGTLYIKDLISHTGSAHVRELMDKKVYYVNETAGLRDALNAFLKTHHHLFVVVNNFEEIVGVLSIEDVLERILGRQIVDEFDRYDDLRAVAAHEAKKEHAAHQEVHPQEPPVEEEE
jgi:CBS domain containing-hemolysin-like protein